MTHKSHRIGVFAGTFRPFTLGHADVVKRALALLDEVHICVGVNVAKPGEAHDAEERAAHIAALWSGSPRVKVCTWSGLTADYATKVGACCLLRSIRSVRDYEYERDMADYHLAACGLDTILLDARPQLAYVSSSLVREMQAMGKDPAAFLPTPQDCTIL